MARKMTYSDKFCISSQSKNEYLLLKVRYYSSRAMQIKKYQLCRHLFCSFQLLAGHTHRKNSPSYNRCYFASKIISNKITNILLQYFLSSKIIRDYE